jgi:predicted nucleic acid-binding Zn ribbon protein
MALGDYDLAAEMRLSHARFYRGIWPGVSPRADAPMPARIHRTKDVGVGKPIKPVLPVNTPLAFCSTCGARFIPVLSEGACISCTTIVLTLRTVPSRPAGTFTFTGRRREYARTCIVCGTPFTCLSPTGRYCSDSCRSKSRRLRGPATVRAYRVHPDARHSFYGAADKMWAAGTAIRCTGCGTIITGPTSSRWRVLRAMLKHAATCFFWGPGLIRRPRLAFT